MSWSIPNLPLHDKLVPLSNMRSLGELMWSAAAIRAVITTPNWTLAVFRMK
jgi:uncharacterized alpha-E superfamily protein